MVGVCMCVLLFARAVVPGSVVLDDLTVSRSTVLRFLAPAAQLVVPWFAITLECF